MRECYACGSIKTYTDKRGFGHWYSNKPFKQWLCENCNNDLIKNPKWHPITIPITSKKWNTIHNAYHIGFRGRFVKLGFAPRTGICSLCGIKKRTSMHHWVYITIFPWFGTRELCVSCHTRQHVKKNRRGFSSIITI